VPKSISMFIPAYNEAKHLKHTIDTIERVRIQNGIQSNQIEYIIVDDGSDDATGEIAESLARNSSNIKVIHNILNRGLGYNLKVAIAEATKDYFGLIPGDNETTIETINIICHEIQNNHYDIYVPYQANSQARPLMRRILSRIYTSMFNLLFRMKLRYYNGLCFSRLPILKKAKLMTDGPSYMAGILIQLIKQHQATYKEIPMYVNSQPGRKSRLLKWKNVYRIAKHIFDLKQHLRTAPLT